MSTFLLETESDMLAYLDPEYGHGVSATHIKNSTETKLNIIFNDEYIEEDILGESLEATNPTAHCRFIDIPNVSQGDSLNVADVKDVNGNILKSATNFTIINVQNDKTGFLVLELEKV